MSDFVRLFVVVVVLIKLVLNQSSLCILIVLLLSFPFHYFSFLNNGFYMFAILVLESMDTTPIQRGGIRVNVNYWHILVSCSGGHPSFIPGK